MSQAVPTLRVDRLTREVDGRRLVNDVSLEIRAGEVVALTGPSGSGKSTLLRLINLLDEPTSGSVYLEGRDTRELAPRSLRQSIALVMQAPHLFPGTVGENIAFGPAQRGRKLESAIIDDLLERVGLPGFRQRDTGILSGGEAQRVSLARSLANEPRVLLLDEPTSALDDRSRKGVERLLFEVVAARGLTCLIVTHNLEQARHVAARGLVLEAGSLVLEGPVSEVFSAT